MSRKFSVKSRKGLMEYRQACFIRNEDYRGYSSNESLDGRTVALEFSYESRKRVVIGW
ncbi:MAG: hypothetical protein IJQ63_06295 [Synergistaceae bacterium]|nr:hypothetical protein [Synergistaceae bacterium]